MCCNWVFNITKKEVFDYLGWIPNDKIQHWEEDTYDHGSYFPEFPTADEALMFLVTAILLHNETQHK